MKIYAFYLFAKDITPEEYPGVCDDLIRVTPKSEYALYAWTNSKEYRKEFKETREPKLFKEKIFEIDHMGDMEVFLDDYNDLELSKEELITGEYINGLQSVSGIKVLLTYREFDSVITFPVDSMSKIWDFANMSDLYTLYSQKIFNPELLFILDHVFFIEDSITCFMSEVCNKEFTDDVIFDQFEIYIRLYKNLLRGD